MRNQQEECTGQAIYLVAGGLSYIRDEVISTHKPFLVLS